MPQTPHYGEFDYYSAYHSAGCVTYIGFEISKEILEGLMSSLNHHKVHRKFSLLMEVFRSPTVFLRHFLACENNKLALSHIIFNEYN